MSLFDQIREAVLAEKVEISDHAYEQLLERGIDFEEVIVGIRTAILLEDYSQMRGEARILVAQKESGGGIIHVVWDAPVETNPNVVLVTAFRSGRA